MMQAGFKRCTCCGVAYPLRVSWDISLCWACGLAIWRGFALPRWRWRLALKLHLWSRRLLQTPADRALS